MHIVSIKIQSDGNQGLPKSGFLFSIFFLNFIHSKTLSHGTPTLQPSE
jgi:hypothetical protein